jgi:hypothetical protein
VDGLSDYHPDRSGAAVRGRMIVPELYDGDLLGEDLRKNPHYPYPVTYEEIKAIGGSNVFPTRGDFGEFADRMAENLLAGL